LLVARTCGSSEGDISRAEAVSLAREAAPFEPCADERCVRVANVPRGIPQRRYWLVGLAQRLDENGDPVRFENFLVDAQTGDVTRP
jgi:hypothetical protein